MGWILSLELSAARGPATRKATTVATSPQLEAAASALRRSRGRASTAITQPSASVGTAASPSATQARSPRSNNEPDPSKRVREVARPQAQQQFGFFRGSRGQDADRGGVAPDQLTCGQDPDQLTCGQDADRHPPDQGDRQHRCRRCRVAAEPARGPLRQSRWPDTQRLVGQPAPQVVGQVGRRRIPPLRVFLQAFQADRLQVAVDSRRQRPGRRRRLVPGPPAGFQRRRRPEGRPAGEQLVQDRAQAVDVGRGRQLLRWPAACSGAM